MLAKQEVDDACEREAGARVRVRLIEDGSSSRGAISEAAARGAPERKAGRAGPGDRERCCASERTPGAVAAPSLVASSLQSARSPAVYTVNGRCLSKARAGAPIVKSFGVWSGGMFLTIAPWNVR
mgnify:CR=1 FL=1